MNTRTVVAVATLSLVACDKKNTFAPPPPVPVTVAHPVVREQVVFKKSPATLKGVTEIDIRARVSGVLEKCFFKEGARVKKGEPLFLIEQPPYIAEVAVAQANLDQSIAARDIALENFNKLKRAGLGAVSQIDIDVAEAEHKQAIAVVARNQASLDQAQLNLEYTEIMAPVSGLMSSLVVDVGNLVDGAPPTLLATITDDSKIRANFEIPERGFLNFLEHRSKTEKFDLSRLSKVQLELADGKIYPHEGTIDLLDSRVDSMTRTASVRAEFPNDKHLLASGLYGLVGYPRVYGTTEESPNAVLIPSRAVLRDLAGDYVWVVDKENIVRRRGVEAGAMVRKPSTDPNAPPEREILILKGLTAEDTVIVSGLQRAREGAPVTPQFADQPGPAAKESPEN